MAHQISINKEGQAEMAYAGDKPWHRLGAQVPGLMNTAEALQASHLNWTVSKIPVLSSYDLEPVPNAFTVIRDDTKAPLGIVGNRYEPISNRDAFQFFDIALGEGQGGPDVGRWPEHRHGLRVVHPQGVGRARGARMPGGGGSGGGQARAHHLEDREPRGHAQL